MRQKLSLSYLRVIQHELPHKGYGVLKYADTVNSPDTFLQLIKRWAWLIIIFASAAQILFWPTLPNLFAVFVVLFSWKLIDSSILRFDILVQYPFSCFMIMGFASSQFFFPVVFTLSELHPVTYNLKVPYEVFLHSLLAVITILVAHRLYRYFLKRQPFFYNAIQRQLIWAGFFKFPRDFQIWLMGIIGLASMFYIYFYAPSSNVETTGAGNKFIQGLIPFTYAPFYILIREMYATKKRRPKNLYAWLGVFTVLLFVVSIGRNARGAFMFGFTGLGFGYFWGLICGIFPAKLLTRKNLLVAAIAIWLIAGPLTDLGTAMVMVRGERANVDRSELIRLTFEKFNNKEELTVFKQTSKGETTTGWDERYLSSIFLSRFCNLKFNDASLELADKLGKIDPVMTSFAIERPLAIFPQPVIDILGLNIDKQRVNSFSTGDMLFERAGGSGLGTFRVGHFAGVGMASFGWLYLFWLFVLIIPVFFLWDILAIRIRAGGRNKTIFGLGALLSLTALFWFLQFENVLYMIQFLIREWIQMVFLYCIMLLATRLIMSFVKVKGN